MTLDHFTKLKSYLLIVVWCGMSTAGFGQLKGDLDKEVILTDFPFTVSLYNARHGLNQNQVDDILLLPDRRSILCATATGLSEFDGYSIKPFPLEINYPRLTYLRKLYQPFGEKKLYAQFPTGSFERLMMKEGEEGMDPYFSFFAVHFSSEYLSYVDTTNCFYRISKTGDTLFSKKIPVSDPILFIHPIDEDMVLFSNGKGLFLTDCNAEGGVQQLGSQTIEFGKKHPRQALIYLAGGNEIWVLDSTLQLTALDFSDFQPSGITDIDFLEDRLVVTALNGFYLMDREGRLKKSKQAVLPTERLYSIAYDSLLRILFIGTADHGLLTLELRNAYSLEVGKNRLSESFSSIVPVSAEEMWTANFADLYSFRTTGQQSLAHVKSFFQPVSSISIIDQKVYVGSWNYYLFEIQVKEPLVSRKIDKYNGVIFGVYKDRANKIWVGSNKGVFQGSSIDELTPFMPDVFSTSIISFFESSNGQLWMGGQRLLVRLDRDRKVLNRWNETDGLTGNDVRSFFEDNKGNIWIGTYNSGLFVFKNGRLINVSGKRNCMLGNDFFTLAPDNFGNLLISSNHGINKVAIQALQDFVVGKKDYLVPFLYDEHCGIYNTEFNGGFSNNYYTPDHEIFYFPSVQGVIKYISQPDRPRASTVQLTSIILDGVTQPEFPTTISRDIKEIIFEFQANHFKFSNNVHYQYRLEKNGTPGTWSNLIKNTSLRITNPGGGRYSLEVRAIDGFNASDPDSVRYLFFVPYLFYEFRIFWILTTLGGSLLVVLFWRFRLTQKQKQLQYDYQLQDRIKELQLQAVQSRMNPHFIFNALNVVNLMIMKGEGEKVTKYLNKFSDLLKEFLAQSQEHFCTLKTEMELLIAYLEIQQIRMEDKLDFEVRYPDSSEEIFIPTMILQPLVENAVVHGIAHKKGKGHILIQATKEDEKIYVVIEDNGIGRVEAGKMRATSNRSSFGIDLVNKKGALLEQQFGIRTTISIIDLEPEAGTRVLVTFAVRPIHISPSGKRKQ